ncbi:dihydroorotate oxidase [Capsaspora owczarzaki ATCC 30864]|uniref:Dihydroorotate dehydrogenase (quinone), mitochondrial n=1 Tax=Capsaspora owczarzaki (strain ATCC 30864) TaxID=595528 RepID=A0A0D2X459_CAPO3|nr:dihydroorotate oxidase [Capsaspora owczarzaki ATCC 30864]KJE95489.1 dihydroorotate oxidase [Capsaspora owczarzaki ATCC 30864]|eukprot:XP_011270596.1 dihydroorotate oxidase [Capsaspora owczarzaki ATCC 30864]
MALRSLLAAVAVGGAAAAFSAASSVTSPVTTHLVMPLVRLLDPETAHVMAVRVAASGLLPTTRADAHPSLATTVWGKQFSNPIGLAAGFDKHADCIDAMLGVGFGFVEIGSVTPVAQPGNPKPRVFRLTDDRAVINRYGFNSFGLDYAHDRLSERVADPAARGFQHGIVGVNLGKNKTTVDAADDYVQGINKLGKFADYIVVNISSPNTPGLRSLQGKQELGALIDRVLVARDRLGLPSQASAAVRGRVPPLLVKIAPDLTPADKEDIASVLMDKKVDGLIVSNTTISRPATLKSPASLTQETGGLSGAPLRQLATETVRDMYTLTQGRLPIIGVGGVSTGDDAFEKILAGASLVQLYSSIVYDGPGIVPKIQSRLAELLAENSFTSVSDAVGAEHRGFRRK